MKMNQVNREELRATYHTTMGNREELVQAYSETRNNKPIETIDRLVCVIGYTAAVETVAELVNNVGEWDGRISRNNRQWAQSIETAATREELEALTIYQPDSIHPAHIDQLAAAMQNYTPEEEPAQEAQNEAAAPTLYEKMTAELEARNDRSAWDKGVTAYALELVEGLEEAAAYNERDPISWIEAKEWMLNGAQDWNQYSWGGSSLIYDYDIAARLCCPSELKKTRDGERRPNRKEEWLDVQTRALAQAYRRVISIYKRLCKEAQL